MVFERNNKIKINKKFEEDEKPFYDALSQLPTSFNQVSIT